MWFYSDILLYLQSDPCQIKGSPALKKNVFLNFLILGEQTDEVIITLSMKNLTLLSKFSCCGKQEYISCGLIFYKLLTLDL